MQRDLWGVSLLVLYSTLCSTLHCYQNFHLMSSLLPSQWDVSIRRPWAVFTHHFQSGQHWNPPFPCSFWLPLLKKDPRLRQFLSDRETPRIARTGRALALEWPSLLSADFCSWGTDSCTEESSPEVKTDQPTTTFHIFMQPTEHDYHYQQSQRWFSVNIQSYVGPNVGLSGGVSVKLGWEFLK